MGKVIIASPALFGALTNQIGVSYAFIIGSSICIVVSIAFSRQLPALLGHAYSQTAGLLPLHHP
ncbi:hypothetical protein IFO70_09570 [Phormidium tenue FACHB-886]|nr:hypothetical protein [Phormidium tenue FACHB-886]